MHSKQYKLLINRNKDGKARLAFHQCLAMPLAEMAL